MTSVAAPRSRLDRASRLTVVLLTYNCARRVEPVLEHLLDLGLRIIAVDNASVDGTADVLDRPGIEVVRLPRNIGAAGRNAGAALVRTPYVLFCDDDGWYDAAGLDHACDLLDAHPRLALVNARILVRQEGRLDPISTEMSQSPVRARDGVPGAVLLSFMAGAVVVRRSAYQQVGGYDPRFFLGGEEETLSFPLAKAGWAMRYVPEVVMHHHPSLANAGHLRAYGMRNTLWTAWLHRRARSALRYTAFTLADTPKNRDYAHGLLMALAGLPWVLAERAPMSRELDADLRLLDQRRYAGRRPWWTTANPVPRRPPVPAVAVEPDIDRAEPTPERVEQTPVSA